MIEIVYEKDNRRITIKGHARSGKAGHDIVCAAVSALTYTLAENIINYEKAIEGVEAKIKLEAGNAEIECICPRAYADAINLVFVVICVGFEKLAQTYPENICYQLI